MSLNFTNADTRKPPAVKGEVDARRQPASRRSRPGRRRLAGRRHKASQPVRRRVDGWPSLRWVDEFIGNVRPYIRVRKEDNLLIRMPNVAHKLNPQGVRVLGFLLDGGSADELLDRVSEPRQAQDIALFLWEVRRCLEGSLREDNHSAAVEVEPLELNFSKLPVLSEVAVTSRCNLSCVFCYAGCSHHCSAGGSRTRSLFMAAGIDEKHRGDMSADEIKRILAKIYHDARAPSVSFTGGEPTLRDDLPELVASARELGLRVNLISNGVRINRSYARRLAAAGLHSAQLSLEGATGPVHDAITGVDGSFERTVAAVKHMESAGVHVHTNTTLNLRNISEAPQMPGFVRDMLGMTRFSMNLVIPSGTASSTAALLLRYSEVGPVLERVIAASERAGVEFMWYSPTPLCIFNPITHGLGNKGCSACDGLLSVGAGGDVLPCSSFDEPVGNLLSDDFHDIWQSGRARALRKKEPAHEHCRRECDHFAVCHGACPLYWDHFGFEELARRRGFAEIRGQQELELV